MPDRKLNYHPLTLWNISGGHNFFREDGYSFYSSMFVEDVTTHIMPYSNRSSSRGKSYQVNISNMSLDVDLKSLFHTSYEYDHFYQNLSEVIFEFIREVAGSLLVRGGRVYYEIVDATFDENEVSKQVYVLKPIGGKIIKFGWKYYQIIPNEVQDVKSRYISVPQSKVWGFKMPQRLGGKKDIVALSNCLMELGKASLLSSEIITNQKDFFGFDVNEFHSSIDAAILRATNKLGWDMRMSVGNQHALEYYRYYRMLRFGYSMALLRTDILSQMNSLLKHLGYDAVISFSGIPTSKEYLNALEKMEHRQFSFKEVADLIYFSV